MIKTKLSFLIALPVWALTFISPAHAQIFEMNQEPVNAAEVDMSLEDIQNDMDPIRMIDAYLIDKTAPRNERGGWGQRTDNTYAPGAQIDAVVFLANVGKHNPGQTNNQHDLELYINIRDRSGNLLDQLRPVHTYRNTIAGAPDQDYFRQRFTVSVRLTQPGAYRVGFVFIDQTRAADQQIPLEVPLEVVVADAQATPSDPTPEGVIYQADMPPMTLLTGMFLDLDASARAGIPVAREADSFAPGERIAIYTKFRNVGRLNPGAVAGIMKLVADIQIFDEDGTLVVDQPAVGPAEAAVTYPYEGPIPDAYFDSFKLTLFTLSDPGEYRIVLTFTDQSRPETETQPVEVTFTTRIN
ncbi:hypothetical protein [Yoonia sp. SS1-5]|uniref:Uncharacterized protein n=1 Tax=Yoonia rhodophyticola TaxID=3137370 RepID=A0AAN0MD10_9RHOB